MGVCFLWAGLTAVWLAQAGADGAADARRQAIERAVAELGDARFAVRRRASRALWQQGLAAEPALRRAAQSADRETRLRARRILDDFRYGILPDVPADVVALIRQFRDGRANQRMAAFQQLANRRRFDTLERLIGLEPHPTVRRQLLVYLMQNAHAVEHFLELERLEELVGSVAADQDETWRRTVLAQLLFAPKMIERAAEKGQLRALVKVVEREASATVRRQMLSMLFNNTAAVGALIEKDQLSLVLELIAKEPEKRIRGDWISRMLISSGAIKHLVASRQIAKVLEFAQQNMDASQRATMLQRMFQNTLVVQAFLAQGGIQRLLELATSEGEPTARGRLRATLIASSAVQRSMTDEARYELTFRLARDERDATARNEYLKTVLVSGAGYALFRDAKRREALWKLAQTDTDEACRAWRGEAIYRMISMGPPEWLGKDADRTKWLLDFLGREASPLHRSRILERLLADSRMRESLLKRGHFDTLLTLARTAESPQRGRLTAQLFSAAVAPDPFGPPSAARPGPMDRSRAALMVRLGKEESDDRARYEYLQILFQNRAAMTAMIQCGFFEDLWGLIRREQDPTRRAVLRVLFVWTPDGLKSFVDKRGLESLVQFAQDADDPAMRRVYLQRLFGNREAMSLLVDKGHFDTLLALADGQDDPKWRLRLLAEFYGNAGVIQHLIAQKRASVLLRFAEQHGAGGRMRSFLQNLLYNQQAIAALVEEEQTELLLALIQQQDKNARRSLIQAACVVPVLVRHFVEHHSLNTLFQLLEKEPVQTREAVYGQWTTRTEIVAILVEQDALDEVVAGLKQESEPRLRGKYLASLIVQPKAIARLRSQRRLQRIIELAREQKEDAARRAFLDSLLANAAAVGALLEQGQFEALYELVSGDKDPAYRAGQLARFLCANATIEYLIREQKLDLLLRTAGQQSNPQARRNVLARLTASSAAMAALVERGQFGQLVALCREGPDPAARRPLIAQLLTSGKAVGELAKTGSLESVVREVLDEPDVKKRRQYLRVWLMPGVGLDAMLQAGLFDLLYRTAAADPDPAERRESLGYLLSRPVAVERLAEAGDIGRLVDLMTEETSPLRAANYVQSLLRSPEALRAVLAQTGFDQFLKLVQQKTNQSAHRSLLLSLLFNQTTFEYLKANDQVDRLGAAILRSNGAIPRRDLVERMLSYSTGRRLLGQARLGDELLALLKDETDEPYRRSAVQRVLQGESLWGPLVASGQADVLFELAKWEPDASRRRAELSRILYDPSGWVAYHIDHGRPEEATRLLEENAVDDLGRLRLATWLLESGRIDQRIQRVRQPGGDARLLTYLLRANGDLPGACLAARAADDPGLQRAVLVEARRWSEAAKLEAAAPLDLPIPTSQRSEEGPEARRAEQLGLVAAYQRLAGNASECQKALDQILDLAHSPTADAKLRLFCVEALLLSDRVDAGLKLLKETYPSRAFDLLAYRHQYREAFELAGWRDGALPDRDWLDSLAADGQDDDQRAVGRLEFGLKVAGTLHRLGKRDQAAAVIDLLEAYADEQADRRSTSSARNQCWQRISVALVSMGLEERAWRAAARTLLSPDTTPPMLSRLYGPRRYHEAWGWWFALRTLHPSELPEERFRRLHQLMTPDPDEDADRFAKLAEEAVALTQSFTDSRRDYVLAAVGNSCRRRGRLELARHYLKAADAATPRALAVRADVLRDGGRWSDAAEAYLAVWEANHDELAALYLSGDALLRAGREAEGQRRKAKAGRLALDSRARLTMAADLVRHGLRDEGRGQLRRVLRTAPFESWEWHEAVRQLDDFVDEDDPAEGAMLQELSLLDDLRTWFYLRNDRDYLRARSTIHRRQARAAIAENRFERAEREIRAALSAAPGDTRVAIELVPQWEAAGQQDRADALFAGLYRSYRAWIEAYPECGLLHNDFAWLCARCGRHVQESLEHAQKAVALAPRNAAYLDTLAECHFRLGDREAAVRYSRRAVALQPESPTLKAQLERFENAPSPDA